MIVKKIKYGKFVGFLIFLIVVVFYFYFYYVGGGKSVSGSGSLTGMKFPVYILWYTGGYKVKNTGDDPERSFGAVYRLAEQVDYIQIFNKEMSVPPINLASPQYYDGQGNPIIWFVERKSGDVITIWLSSIPGFDNESYSRLKPITGAVIEKITTKEFGVKLFDWVGKTVPIKDNPIYDLLLPGNSVASRSWFGGVNFNFTGGVDNLNFNGRVSNVNYEGEVDNVNVSP